MAWAECGERALARLWAEAPRVPHHGPRSEDTHTHAQNLKKNQQTAPATGSSGRVPSNGDLSQEKKKRKKRRGKARKPGALGRGGSEGPLATVL